MVRSIVDPTDGRAHEEVGSRFPCGTQKEVEILDRFLHGLLRRPWIAPAETGAIIRADPGSARDLLLNQRPVNGERPCSRHQNHGRSAFAGAMEVQLAAAAVDEPARGRISW